MKWTKEEEEYLIANYQRGTKEELSKTLNRKFQTIQQKAIRMGLLKPQKWTNEDDNFLKEKWGHIKLSTIAKKLNRTERAVEERAYNILKLGTQVSWYSLKEISEILGVSKCAIRKRIIKTNFPHYRGKTKQKPYMLDEAQLKRFLKENKDLWHYGNLSINVFEGNHKWIEEKIEADKSKVKKYKKSWSEEEDFLMLDMLRNNYTYDDIAFRLGRTIEGVKGRHRYKYRCKI